MTKLKTINKPSSACIILDTKSSLRKKTWKPIGNNPKFKGDYHSNNLRSNNDIHSDNPRSIDDNLTFNNDMLAINLDPTTSTSAIWQQGYLMT
jgi:hypothetical protein